MESGSVVFDRYRLDEWIGAGGTGVVWRATDLLLDQPVALKRVCLAGVEAGRADFDRERALDEARLAARLRHHRHVVATYDVRVDDSDMWLVLEYLPSRSLAQILRERGPLDPAQAARIGAQVADALAAAHALGIEHRDVTPGNVLITDDGTAKLTDFGISRLAGDTQLTQTKAISGTFAFLAPEVARTGKSSAASDVFALGATLYTAIEGQPPFGAADNAFELLSKARAGIIRPPTTAGEFTPLLMRLLALHPATRPDAATARFKLDEFATRANAAHHFLPATPEPWRRWLPRRPVLTAILAVLIVAALAAGTSLALTGPSHDVAGVVVPALPATVGPVALTGDVKAADPCALIDPIPLRQFGQPFITFSYILEGCQARIATARGDVDLDLYFDNPAPPEDSLGAAPQRIGKLTIVRKGVRQEVFSSSCENVLMLADRTQIHVDASGSAPDLCAITEVGIATAVTRLARDGITYRPDRIAGLPIAGIDACALLDRPELAKFAGLDPDVRTAGFANWSCTWGSSGAGYSHIELNFRLDGVNISEYGDPTTIAGRRAWLRTIDGTGNLRQCNAYVVHRPAPSATGPAEMFSIDIDAPLPPPDLCARATELATAVEAQLPASS